MVIIVDSGRNKKEKIIHLIKEKQNIDKSMKHISETNQIPKNLMQKFKTWATKFQEMIKKQHPYQLEIAHTMHYAEAVGAAYVHDSHLDGRPISEYNYNNNVLIYKDYCVAWGYSNIPIGT